jgi:hypothetical protein
MEAVLDFERGCQDLAIILLGGCVGGGGLPPPANPDNVAAGGATDARCGEGGSLRGERGDMKQITAHSNPYSSFSLSLCPLCIRRGFDKKFCTWPCRTVSNVHINILMKLSL